jgi:BirA family biotin operon repressor/biotin-[acetyl-CoA-carboxylase] ligase
MLSPESIREGLATSRIGRDVRVFSLIDSTNDHVLELGRQGVPEGTLVVAESQRRGRGRLGRRWESPPGCNLYFSVLLRPPLAPVAMAQITLMSGVSLCEALRGATGLDVMIKWPNDLWICGRKVGGILTETAARGKTVPFVVVGIGLNVNLSEKEIPEELEETATSLFLAGKRRFDRVALLRILVQALDRDYLLFLEEGFEPFRRRFAAYSLTVGRTVSLEQAGREVQGTAEGITRTGALQVREKNGALLEVLSGDVTLH